MPGLISPCVKEKNYVLHGTEGLSDWLMHNRRTPLVSHCTTLANVSTSWATSWKSLTTD